MKEADSSLLAVLSSIFTPLAQRRIKELGLKTNEESLYVSRLSREIEALGKESTVATGDTYSR
jgi:chromosome transmission fidelity protein 18